MVSVTLMSCQVNCVEPSSLEFAAFSCGWLQKWVWVSYPLVVVDLALTKKSLTFFLPHRQDAANNCFTRLFGSIQGNLGSPSCHCSHFSHCKLGDGAEEILPGAQGFVLLWVSEAP
jgi:hypothetical protein